MKKESGPFKFHLFMVLILLCVVVISCQTPPNSRVGWHQLPTILNQIIAPEFPDQDFSIMDFGAQGDGITDCTDAFRKAVDACYIAGGGRVLVPAGVFLTGAIHLKSHVNLHIEKGAIVLFSQDIGKYLPVVFTRFEGVELMNFSPFIYAFEQENMAITGTGILNGNADSTAWWPWAGSKRYGWKEGMPNQKYDRDSLFQMAEDGVPVEDRIFGKDHHLRANFIQFYRCKNIIVEGITIKQSPMWEIHPVLSENIIVRNIHIKSHGPNNDGCNPESCKNVLIKNCYFDTGDDCIAIKSGRNGDGRRVNVASENIVIQECQMKDGHGGVVIGSEISGSCRNVYAENCIMDSPNLDRALRIKTNSLRGGVVENIFMRNVTIGEVSDAVVRIFFHYEKGDVGEFTPIVRNISVENVTSQKSRYALLLDGYERSPIQSVSIIDCEFSGVAEGNLLNFVSDLQLENVYINGIKQ